MPRPPGRRSAAGGPSVRWTRSARAPPGSRPRKHRLAETRRRQSESAANVALALGLACALGSVLLIIGFAAYLRGLILRPVKRVAAAAERFAGGDRTARAPTGGATELDLLARSFNDMAHTVQVESAERARVQAELRERGDEFRALAENSPDIIVRVDAEMHISYVNSVVVGVTGLTAESFLGRSILEIEGELPVPLDWSRALREVLDTGEPRRIEHPFESPAGTVWFESRMIPETSPDGVVGHALVLARDVTDTRATETRLRANEREQDALRRVATKVASEGSAPELFALVAEEAGRLLDMEMAGVSRFVPVGPALVEGAWSAPGAVGDGAVDESWGDAVTLTGEATIFGAPPGPGEGGAVIGVAAPIRVGQRLWGAVAASTTRPGAIDPAATGILSRFAELASLAISSAEAREQLLALAFDRPADRPAQPAHLHRAPGRRGREGRPPRAPPEPDDDRHRPLQAHQRHPRARGGEPGADRDRPPAGGARARGGHRRPGGRRGVRLDPSRVGRAGRLLGGRARALRHLGDPVPRGRPHHDLRRGLRDRRRRLPRRALPPADAALYSAKAQGRNTTARWSPDDAATPTRSSPEAST